MSLHNKSLYRKLSGLVVVSLLLINVFLFSGIITSVFASPALTLKWSRNLGSNAKTEVGPLAVNLVGDDKLEIIVTGGNYVGDPNGFVTVLNGITGAIIWQVSPGGVGQKTPFDIADLNGDGKLEIVIYGLYPVVLHGSNGSVFWKNTAVSSYNDQGAVLDVDGDGYSEIFVSSGKGPYQGYDYFTMLSYDGKVLRQNPTSWHPCWGGLTIGDANFDGRFELYQGDRRWGYRTQPTPEEPYINGGWGVSCLDALTLTRLWNDSDITCSSHTPMLADVDKDGTLDVIVANQGIGSGGLVVLNAANGSVVTTGGKYRKSLNLGLYAHSQPTIADVDDDGNLEIITCRDSNPQIWDLYDWKLDATLPIVCHEPPKVGDITGDGKLDIIAVRPTEIYIYSYDKDNESYYQTDYVPAGGNAFTLVQDVDSDGYNELIVTTPSGIVRCYDTPASAPSPKVRSNVQFYSERHCGAAEYVPPPGPPAPVISEPSPENGATNVPTTLSQLTFKLTDYQHDPISYTVTTYPYIGSANGANVPNGKITVPISGLSYSTTYTWTVTATDGTNINTKTFTFTTSDLPPWYNTDWQYRRTIVIDHTKVSSDQTNFPVIIDLTDLSLTTKAQPDGDDFLFTDESNNKLDHQIEHYDSATGHLIAWVKIPHLSSTTDTKIYLYYGNRFCGSQQNPTAVWDASYKLVLHLNEQAGMHYDSTMYGNNGTPLNSVQQGISAKIDGGDTFDGTNDYVEIAHSNTLSGYTDALTISFWVKFEDTSRRQTILGKYNSGTNQRAWFVDYNPVERPTRPFGFYASPDGTNYREWYASFVPAANTWYYVTVVWEAGKVPVFYINGVQVPTAGTATITQIYNNVGVPLHIARSTYNTARYLKGSLDEIRISNPARSAGYILTCYNNQLNPSAFYTVGTEESLPNEPMITNPSPPKDATNVPITLTELSFTLIDYQHDEMNFTVTTSPDIGSRTEYNVESGTYTVPISGLKYAKTYTWTVTATDGTYTTTKTFKFTTELAPSADDIIFDSSFDMGNLINVTYVEGRTGYRHYKAAVRYTIGTDPAHTGYSARTNNDKHWWFYFSMENAAGKTIAVSIVNGTDADWSTSETTGNRWPEIEPVYSYDNINWYRVPLSCVAYDRTAKVFTINITVPSEYDKVWLAPLPPYNIARREALFAEFAGSPYLTVASLGTTPGGQQIKVATITDPAYPDAAKFRVYVIAQQHAGEVPGSWNAEGLIRFLLSDDQTAAAIRRSYIFRIIPIVNVDAVYQGICRYTPVRNGFQYDLNRWWNVPTDSNAPFEVRVIYQDIQAFKPHSFNDFHSTINVEQTSPKEALTYTWSTTDPTLNAFLDKIKEGGWPETVRAVSTLTGGAFQNVRRLLGVNMSLSWENPHDELSTKPGVKLTVNDWMAWGAAWAKGNYLYFGDARIHFLNAFPGSATTSTSLAVSYPLGLQAGDLILLQVTVRDTTNEPTTTPTGFTPLFGPDSTGTGRQWIYYKFATGSESGTLSVSIGGSAVKIGRMYAFRNVAPNNFVEGGNFTSGSGSTISAPSVTTSGDGRLAVAFVFVNYNSAVGSFTGESGGDWKETIPEYTTTSGSRGCIQLQTALMTSKGTISGGSYTMSASYPWGVRAFALKPSIHTLTVNVVGEGSVSVTPAKTYYTFGEIVTLKAVPESYYEFDHWSGNLTGNNNPATITMNESMMVTAHFIIKQYAITASTSGIGGTINPSGEVLVTKGQNQTFIITPGEGYHISDVIVDGSSVGPVSSYTFYNINANHTITAVFAQNQYILTVNIIGGGTVTKNPDKPFYTYSETVQLTAIVASTEWTFSGWSGATSGLTNPITITITANTTVSATFTLNNWWNRDWQYRRTITIDRTKVSGTLTNFPVLIEIIDSNLVGKTQPDGDDFVFTDINNVKLDHQIEYYDSATGHLIVWVKVPYISSSADTTLYMYYGNQSCGSQQNPTAVWDTSYKLVLHLNEKTGIHYDSTINRNNGTPLNGVQQGVTAKIDGGDTFDGTNDYIEIAHSNTLSGYTDALTISFWVKFEDPTRRQTILGKYNTATAQRGWFIDYNPKDRSTQPLGFYASWDGTNYREWYANFVPQAGIWYYITIVWTANAVPRFYINGVQVATVGTATIPQISNNVGVPLLIGRCQYDNARYFKGSLDEITISNPARPVNWIQTAYNNQLNPAAFISLGPVEEFEEVYMLTVTVTGQGSVTIEPKKPAYKQDDSVTLTASAEEGYEFVGWIGDVTSTKNPLIIIITKNMNITAHFQLQLKQYVINATVSGTGGTIAPSGLITVYHGEDKAFTITPDTNYYIFDVIVDSESQGPIETYTFHSVTANHTIIALFAPNEYTLTIEISPPGGGVVNVNKTFPYYYGDVVELTAVPTSGWSFAYWKGDLSGNNETAVLIVDKNKIVEAIFIQNQPPVNRPPRIDYHSPADLEIEITEGQNIIFEHVSSDPDGDLLEYNWLLNGVSVAASQNWTFITDYNSAGFYNVTLTVTDGDLTVKIQWNVNVLNINRPPQINSPNPSTDPTILEGDTQEFSISPFDPDGEDLLIEWYVNSNLVKINATAYTFISNYNSAGTYIITVKVSDGLEQAVRQWTLTVIDVPMLLVDSGFDESTNNEDLRANGAGQDWYESRGAFGGTGRSDLLTLDTSNVGGNTGNKAALKNYGIRNDTYLTQEFSTLYTGTFPLCFEISFDIYIDKIEDNANYDRTGHIYIGDDSVATNAPTGQASERFVLLAFYDPTPGDTGTDLELRARTLNTADQTWSNTALWVQVATGLSYDTWYRIRIVVNVTSGTYDVYINGVLAKAEISKMNEYPYFTPIKYVTFSADSDGRGDFYVDNVEAFFTKSYSGVHFVSAGTASTGTGTSLTPNYPVGLQAGDLILLQVTVRSTTIGVTAPNGWSVLYGPDSTGTGRQWIFYKFATSSEAGTLTVSIGSGTVAKMARMYAFRNAASESFNESGIFAFGTGSTISAPQVTTSGDGYLLVAFVFVNYQRAVHSFIGETGGDWVETVPEVTYTSGSGGCIQLQIAVMPVAGPVSGGSYTMDGASAWGVRAFAIKSAP